MILSEIISIFSIKSLQIYRPLRTELNDDQYPTKFTWTDTVNHIVLLAKFERTGVRGNTAIQSLQVRFLVANVNEHNSEATKSTTLSLKAANSYSLWQNTEQSKPANRSHDPCKSQNFTSASNFFQIKWMIFHRKQFISATNHSTIAIC